MSIESYATRYVIFHARPKHQPWITSFTFLVRSSCFHFFIKISSSCPCFSLLRWSGDEDVKKTCHWDPVHTTPEVRTEGLTGKVNPLFSYSSGVVWMGPQSNLRKTLRARRELASNLTHIWHRPESNLIHTGGRHVLSPLHHPCSPDLESSMPIIRTMCLLCEQTS